MPPPADRAPSSPDTAILLAWIPLGAGGSSVAFNGRMFEALQARREHRARDELYHAALEVLVPAGRVTIELAPVLAPPAPERGVVGEGPVGAAWAGRLKVFRYELRCWRGGVIPDLGYAVDGPRTVSTDPAQAERLLAAVPSVPLVVWGRDQLRTGEMWTSNSVVSWLLVAAGLDAEALRLPPHGRAPGWDAGLVAGRRRFGGRTPDAAPLTPPG